MFILESSVIEKLKIKLMSVEHQNIHTMEYYIAMK